MRNGISLRLAFLRKEEIIRTHCTITILRAPWTRTTLNTVRQETPSELALQGIRIPLKRVAQDAQLAIFAACLFAPIVAFPAFDAAVDLRL